MTNTKTPEPLSVVYSIKLTHSQRIRLLQIGGPKWIRNQIEQSTELPGLAKNNAGQVCPRCLHQTSTAGRGD
jgi:hypothetical protein